MDKDIFNSEEIKKRFEAMDKEFDKELFKDIKLELTEENKKVFDKAFKEMEEWDI